MKLRPLIDDFIKRQAKQRIDGHNEFVRAKGFTNLYVRCGRGYIAGTWRELFIEFCAPDFPPRSASRKKFKVLVEHLHRTFPELSICVYASKTWLKPDLIDSGFVFESHEGAEAFVVEPKVRKGIKIIRFKIPTRRR